MNSQDNNAKPEDNPTEIDDESKENQYAQISVKRKLIPLINYKLDPVLSSSILNYLAIGIGLAIYGCEKLDYFELSRNKGFYTKYYLVSSIILYVSCIFDWYDGKDLLYLVDFVLSFFFICLYFFNNECNFFKFNSDNSSDYSLNSDNIDTSDIFNSFHNSDISDSSYYSPNSFYSSLISDTFYSSDNSGSSSSYDSYDSYDSPINKELRGTFCIFLFLLFFFITFAYKNKGKLYMFDQAALCIGFIFLFLYNYIDRVWIEKVNAYAFIVIGGVFWLTGLFKMMDNLFTNSSIVFLAPTD